MKAELLEKLLDAGFSKDEIIQLARDEPSAAEPAAEPAAAPEPVIETAEAPAEPAAAPKEPGPDYDKFNERLALIEGNLNTLTKAIQANAVSGSVMPGGMPNTPTAEDMLAEIIRPKITERM